MSVPAAGHRACIEVAEWAPMLSVGSPAQRPLEVLLPAGWLALFYFLIFRFSSVIGPPSWAAPALASAGLVLAAWMHGEALARFLRQHRAILLAAIAVAAGIAASEAWLALRGLRRVTGALPPQTGLLLCLPALAVFLRDRTQLRWSVLLFGALCLWHLVALPIEGLTGSKWSWNQHDLRLPREAGPLRFQASGLAWLAYFFPGLFLPLFFLAVGPALEQGLWWRGRLTPRTWLALGLLWLLAVACVQSRSAFFGVAAATVLAMVASSRHRGARTWLALGALALAGAIVFWLMFSAGKSGAGLRWVYAVAYLQRAVQWPWILTGRGYLPTADPEIQLPGLVWLPHSHNDVLQMLYSWGLPVLTLYLVLWATVLRGVAGLWRQGLRWPLLSVVAVAPSFVTDLGFHHYEKAAFLVLLAGMVTALAPARPSTDGEAGLKGP